MTCFMCPRPATWELHQAGHQDTKLHACRLHTDKALHALLDTGEPPKPVAEVFAIVTKLISGRR